MTPELLDYVTFHISSESPREACGVLVWTGKDEAANLATYMPCNNIHQDPENHFLMLPDDWVAAEDSGKVLGVVHSHPGGTTALSEHDIARCNKSRVPWWVFDGEGNWKRYTPEGWKCEGKPFAWGIQDCFTVVRDMHPETPDFVRSPYFWREKNMIVDFMESAGFEVVTDGPQIGDIIIMSIRGDGVPNHCAVYVGNEHIFHHLPNRVARREALWPLVSSVKFIARRVAS